MPPVEIGFSSNMISPPTRWSSWSGYGSTDQSHQLHDRIEGVIHHPLLERDDGVVGDGDALGADGGAALGDVAEADPVRLAELLAPVEGVEGVHFERRGVDQVARAHELLVQVMVAQHVADVLAEEALD